MAAGLGFKTFTTGEVLTAADTNGYLMQGVLVFASSAARDAAITSPQEGQFAYLKDTNVTTYYTGSAWANLDTTGMTNPMTTTGDMIYSSSGSTPARLGIGTTGQVITVAGGIPSWATPAASGSALTLINTTTLSGATTNVDSVFTSTYDNYLIQLSMDSNTSVGALTMQLRASGTATTTGYYYAVRQTDWAGVAATAANGSNAASARLGTHFNGSPSPVTFQMFNPNKALRTTFQGLSQGGDTGASGSQMYMGGFQSATTQFDGFSIVGGSQTGKVRIYGYSN